MIRGTVYFSIVFGVGFILGVIRVLLLEPSLGERLAELVEAPVMLIAIVVAARFVTRRYPARRKVDFLASGGLALLLLLSAEFSVALGLRGVSIGEYFAERDPIAGSVYALMLLVFAAMPALIGRIPPVR
jgi:hypothetical protein